jgi:mRNA-degrading endonuclease RelE of RelBE toxin-antitoxin system
MGSIIKTESIMNNLKKLFIQQKSIVNKRYFERALYIQTQLNCGQHYQSLGGQRLVLAKELIRFKLGAYRLIFKRNSMGYTPEFLLPRKDLNRFLKRR